MGSRLPFANNWAYLETELTWLERLLLVAVSQQRKTLKSVSQVSKTSSDQATSDWWQGLIAIKHRAYDDVAPQAKAQPSLGYQKTLDKRILLSRATRVALGLPTMQMVLGLSLFEKKLVLMALAPEVQSRYGRLYHYLQTGEHCMAGSLPTVELALRLLCRNDIERRRARTRLSGSRSLLRQQVLHCVEGSPTLLGSQLALAPDWVDYLLAEYPDPAWPQRFVASTRFAQLCSQQTPWSKAVLTDTLKQQLQTIIAQPKSRVLLVGERRTGKKLSAIAMATQLKQPLYSLNLGQIAPQNWPNCLAELDQASYPVILIEDAHHWLGRESTIERAKLQQWLTQSSAHLIFAVRYRHLVRHCWRQQLTMIDMPHLDPELRLQLWQQVFPTGIKGMGKVRWHALAQGLELTRAQIVDLAKTTQTLANKEEITLTHLQQSLTQQGYSWSLR